MATLQNTFQMMIRMAIRCPMMLILALVSAMGISVRLSLVYCVALPILICALLCLIPKVFRIFDRVFRTYDKMNNVVQENVHGIRVVKSFVREDRETEKFTSVSGTIYKDFCKAERIMSLANPIMQLCVYGCMLAISWIGAHLVIASGNNPDLGLTTGQLSSMFTYTSQILSSLMMLSMVAVMLTMSRAPLKRCYEILTEQPNLTSPTENAVMEVPDGSIDFENVSFRYSATAKHRALKEVNLHIPSGATVGILGGTGSSKTTLVQLIPRLYDVSEGTLEGGRHRRPGVRSLRPSGTTWPWCCKRTCCSPAPSRKTSAGATPTPPTRSWFTPARLAQRRRVHPELPRRLRHPHRAGRHQRLRRPEAASVHRPGAAEKAQDPHSGRLHLRRGHPHRRHDPPGVPGGNSRHHQAHHRPADRLRAGRGHDRRAGRRHG